MKSYILPSDINIKGIASTYNVEQIPQQKISLESNEEQLAPHSILG
jgi:hypothetical protein